MFVEKTRKVFSSLTSERSGDYETVKTTVLSAYELVPEAYRQKFRMWMRKTGPTDVGFAWVKAQMFDQWYRSLKEGKTFDRLREVVLMEELKNSVP